MAAPSLHALYSATVSGRLDRFLTKNPSYRSLEVARHLDDDFGTAVEFGDMVTASIAAAAGSLIFEEIGMPEAALDLRIRQLRVQADTASASDHAEIRDRALVAAARADELGAARLVQLGWLLAGQSAQRAGQAAAGVQRQVWLHRALLDLADLCELLAELPVAQRPLDILTDLAGTIAAAGPDALDARWDAALQLPGRSAIRRLARVAERVLPRDLATAPGSPLHRRETRDRLLRVLLEGGDGAARTAPSPIRQPLQRPPTVAPPAGPDRAGRPAAQRPDPDPVPSASAPPVVISVPSWRKLSMADLAAALAAPEPSPTVPDRRPTRPGAPRASADAEALTEVIPLTEIAARAESADVERGQPPRGSNAGATKAPPA